MNRTLVFLLGLASVTACNNPADEINKSQIESWELGWRMIGSSIDNNYPLGEAQFDSLLADNAVLETKFLVTGLEILHELGKEEKLTRILQAQNAETLQELCQLDLFKQKLNGAVACKDSKMEEVSNPQLQRELIEMFVNDQAIRGNMMEDMIAAFNIDKSDVKTQNSLTVDAENVNRLKEIFQQYGFPTREMVGKKAMHGVFLMIQHADGDTEWQKSQLTNIEKAVKRGDMEGQSYAYLYDRIKMNAGEKQLYGTQFDKVDPVTKTVELADTEDLENLDKRRMEVGMMPIKMYKEMMLKNM